MKIRALMILGIAFLMSSCDWYHKNKCEWYLVPEPDHANKVEEGWVALCARNYVINKQRCLLKSKLKFAKQVFRKPFRYNTMVVKPGTYPKEVESIKVCKPEKEGKFPEPPNSQ